MILDEREGPDDGLVLLATQAMRARRRAVAIAFVWAWELAWGAAIAWPVARVVKAAYGDNPAGDMVLFRPGSLELIDLVWHAHLAPSALIGHWTVLVPVALVSGLFPLAALITSIAYTTRSLGAPPLGALARRALAALPAFATLLLFASVVQMVVVGLAFAIGSGLADSLTPSLGEALAQQLAILLAAPFIVASAGIGIVHDLSRAAVVRFRVPAVRASALAWNAFRRHPLSGYWSWIWRTGAGWVPVLAGSVVASRLGGREGVPLLLLAAMHQLVMGARVALRASWLAKALRKVDHAHRVLRVRRPPPDAVVTPPREIETAARTDEPAAPIPDPDA